MGRLSDHEPRAPRHVQQHPTGWEPALEWSEPGGTISTGPMDHAPDAAIWELLRWRGTSNQNWLPGETLDDLRAENVEHGLRAD